MFSKIKNVLNGYSGAVPDSSVNDSKYLIAKNAVELLKSEQRQSDLRKIKRLLSVTEDVWENHYLYAVSKFAELVQLLPASEVHHHSYDGGLLDHTLDALHLGIKSAQGFVLPPNCSPEKIVEGAEKWRFGAFVAILSHDLGKVVTDIEVVFRECSSEGFVKWHPWSGILPLGSEYAYRYKEKVSNSTISKQLHEKAAVSLLPGLLTEKACQWLFSDVELVGQILSTITHSTFGGGAISEIVKMADGGSVSKNMGARGVVSDSSAVDRNTSLADKLITAFRTLANTGSFKRNRPGAAIWITKDHTWAVSKAAMESVRDHLLAEGHTGIPKNPVSLFSILNERGLIIPNQSGESVWTAEIRDTPNNWNQKLTFLKFDNSVVWPNSVPPYFDGEVALDSDLESEKENSTNEAGEDISDKHKDDSTSKSDITLRNNYKKKVNTQKTTEGLKTNAKTKQENVRMSGKVKPESAACVGISIQETMELPCPSIKENDFFVWLFKNINKRKLVVNSPKSPIHFTKDYVLLVTPSIYLTYFNSSPLKKSLYKSKSGSKPPHTALQREIEALGIHKKNHAGQNICKVLVTGTRSQSDMQCYVFDRSHFPEFTKFSANSALNVIFN